MDDLGELGDPVGDLSGEAVGVFCLSDEEVEVSPSLDTAVDSPAPLEALLLVLSLAPSFPLPVS